MAPAPEKQADGWAEWKRVVVRHIEDEDEFQKEIRGDMRTLHASMIRLETKVSIFRWVVGLFAPIILSAIVSFLVATRF